MAHDSVDKLVVRRLCEDLLDRGVRPWLDIWDLRPGGDWRTHIRGVIANAPAVLVCQGPGVWCTEDHELLEALQARFEVNPSSVYRVELPNASDVLLSVGESCEGVKLEEGDWAEGVTELAHLIGVDAARANWLAYEMEHDGVSNGEFGPYRGLKGFREHDARWMFGRNEEIGELLAILRGDGAGVVTVVGASGSGKSSLLMAGVCPAVRNGAMGDGRAWEIAYLRPGARPCESLAHALVSLQASRGPHQDPVAEGMKVGDLRDKMLASTDTLRLVVSRVVSSHLHGTPAGKILLVVDQLEELFTEAKLGREEESSESIAFVRNIKEGTQRGSALRVVSTLRADFMQRCLEIGELARLLESGTYLALPPMGAEQLRAAVERPAKRVGFEVEPGLVERLVGGTAERAERLSLLQHVLQELWRRRDPQRRSVLFEDYAEIGELEGSVNSH